MKALDINDKCGANWAALIRAGINQIKSTPHPPQYIIPHIFPQTPNITQPDIITLETETITTETINTLQKHPKPKLAIIDSPNKIYRSHSKTLIQTIEEDYGYIIAGVKYKNNHYHYKKNTFTINTKNFNTPLNDENTYLILFNKNKYMDFAKEIRQTPIPQTNHTPYTNKLPKHLDIPQHDPQYYLTPNEATKATHRKIHILDASTRAKTPTTPQQMKKTGKYQLIQDDPWQVQGHINKKGLRYPTPFEYAKIQGYIGYAFTDDKQNDPYKVQNLPTTQLYQYFTNTISIQPTETIVKKYIQQLKQYDGRLK